MSTEGLHQQVGIQTEDTLAGPGARMRQAREAAAWSVEEVARQLRLKPKMIRNMEEDDYNNAPRIVFMRGYLRGYAKLLSLPEDEIISSFNALGIEEASQQPPTVIKQIPQARHHTMQWASGVIILLVLLSVVFWWNAQKTESVASAPAVKAEQAVVLEPQISVQTEVKPDASMTVPAAIADPAATSSTAPKSLLGSEPRTENTQRLAPLIEDLTDSDLPSDRDSEHARRVG